MSIAFAWFSYRDDELSLEWSINSVFENIGRPGDGFFVLEEESAPLSATGKVRLQERFGVTFLPRPAMGNLGGFPSVPRQVLELLCQACTGFHGVWKVDSDTLCFGSRWRDLLGRENVGMLGAERQDGFLGSYGFSYYIRTDKIVGMLSIIDEHAKNFEEYSYAEDMTISTAFLAAGGTLALLDDNPDNCLWAAWGYEYNARPSGFYRRYDFVTFGNRHLIPEMEDKRGCVATTMARVYEEFQADERRDMLRRLIAPSNIVWQVKEMKANGGEGHEWRNVSFRRKGHHDRRVDA